MIEFQEFSEFEFLALDEGKMNHIWDWDEVDRLRKEKRLGDFNDFRSAYKAKHFGDAEMCDKHFENLFKSSKKRPHRSQENYIKQIADVLGVDWKSLVKATPSPAERDSDEADSVRPARLHILRPIDMAYSNDIIFAFLGELYCRCGEKIFIDTHVAIPGCASDYAGSHRQTHLDYAKWVINRQKESLDSIIVTVGTPALRALKESLNEEYGKTPVIFLGCTLPAHANHLFVVSMTNRSESQQVAGVEYNSDMCSLFSFLHHSLLGESTLGLAYFYRKGLDMDGYVGNEFEKFQNAIHGRNLKTVEMRGLPTTRTRGLDRNWMYFGWHTAEELFLAPEGKEFLQERMVISPTRRFVQYGLTALGYQADDIEIGRAGADLLIGYLRQAGSRLERLDIVSTPFRCWVNAQRLKEWEDKFDFRLPEAIRDNPNTIWY